MQYSADIKNHLVDEYLFSMEIYSQYISKWEKQLTLLYAQDDPIFERETDYFGRWDYEWFLFFSLLLFCILKNTNSKYLLFWNQNF